MFFALITPGVYFSITGKEEAKGGKEGEQKKRKRKKGSSLALAFSHACFVVRHTVTSKRQPRVNASTRLTLFTFFFFFVFSSLIVVDGDWYGWE